MSTSRFLQSLWWVYVGRLLSTWTAALRLAARAPNKPYIICKFWSWSIMINQPNPRSIMLLISESIDSSPPFLRDFIQTWLRPIRDFDHRLASRRTRCSSIIGRKFAFVQCKGMTVTLVKQAFDCCPGWQLFATGYAAMQEKIPWNCAASGGARNLTYPWCQILLPKSYETRLYRGLDEWVQKGHELFLQSSELVSSQKTYSFITQPAPVA